MTADRFTARTIATDDAVYEFAYRLAWEHRPNDTDLAFWSMTFAKGLQHGLEDGEADQPRHAEVRPLR